MPTQDVFYGLDAMKDSVVMPVHEGDGAFLPYSLAALNDFLGQLIFVYDKPTNFEKKKIERFIERRENAFIVRKTGSPFDIPNRSFASFICGSLHAYGDRVFWIAPDIIVPRQVFTCSLKLPAKFRYIDYPNHIGYAWFSFLSLFTKSYCLEVFPRNFPYQDYEWRSEEILYTNKPTKVIRFFLCNNVVVKHLKRTRIPERHFIQGMARRKEGKTSLRVILHSILFNHPDVLKGYLHAYLKEEKIS